MERFVTLSTGVRVEYVESGSPDGIPVMFLHGVTDSWRSFERVLAWLPPSVHAFAISQRGHGESSRPSTGYTYSAMSEDLRAFMDAKGVDRAVVVGHSMGSMVAQRFGVDHPDRVAALVLMGAFSTLFHHQALADFVRSNVAALGDPIDPEFAREWQLSTTARPLDEELVATVINETRKVPSRVWRAAFEGFLSTPDFTAQLANVQVPTLLVWGDRDTYAVRGDQDRLFDAIPRARLLVYEGAGHSFHWEDPEGFARDLVPFVLANGGRQVAVDDRLQEAGVSR